MIDLSTLALSLLLAAQPQAADADEAVETETTELAANNEEAAEDEDKIICRRTAVIGSKFKKRICGTKKQWETLENRSKTDTRDLQRSGKGLEPVN